MGTAELMVREVQIRLEKYRQAICISPEVFRQMDVRSAYDVFVDAYVVTLCRKLPTVVTREVWVEWPEDWWQHFKDRWFPNWLKKRLPVKMAKRHIDAVAHLEEFPWPEDERFRVRTPAIMERYVSEEM